MRGARPAGGGEPDKEAGGVTRPGGADRGLVAVATVVRVEQDISTRLDCSPQVAEDGNPHGRGELAALGGRGGRPDAEWVARVDRPAAPARLLLGPGLDRTAQVRSVGGADPSKERGTHKCPLVGVLARVGWGDWAAVGTGVWGGDGGERREDEPGGRGDVAASAGRGDRATGVAVPLPFVAGDQVGAERATARIRDEPANELVDRLGVLRREGRTRRGIGWRVPILIDRGAGGGLGHEDVDDRGGHRGGVLVARLGGKVGPAEVRGDLLPGGEVEPRHAGAGLRVLPIDHRARGNIVGSDHEADRAISALDPGPVADAGEGEAEGARDREDGDDGDCGEGADRGEHAATRTALAAAAGSRGAAAGDAGAYADPRDLWEEAREEPVERVPVRKPLKACGERSTSGGEQLI